MSGFQILLTTIIEGLLLGASYCLLFIPLLYFNTHHQRVLYGSIMTAVLTIVGSALYFFRVIRPIVKLNHRIHQALRGIAPPVESMNSVQDAGAAYSLFLGRDETNIADALQEERRRIENTLHLIPSYSKGVIHRFVWEQHRAVNDLLRSVLKWENGIVQQCQQRFMYLTSALQEQTERQGSVQQTNDDGIAAAAGVQPSFSHTDTHSEGSNSLPVGFETMNLQEVEPSLFSPMDIDELEQDIINEAENLERDENKNKGPPIAKKDNCGESIIPVTEVDPTRVNENINDKSKGKKEQQLNSKEIDNSNGQKNYNISKTTRRGSSDMARLNRRESALSQDNKRNQYSNSDDTVSIRENPISSSLKSRSTASVFAPTTDKTRRPSAGGESMLVTLQRGNRFATDNYAVFFYLTLKRSNLPDTIIGFEASLVTRTVRDSTDNNNNNSNDTETASLQIISLSETAPFKMFTLTSKGERVSLSDSDAALLGFLSCELESEGIIETPNASGEVMTSRPLFGNNNNNNSNKVGSGNNVNGGIPRDKRLCFVVSWAVLPDMPIRLTTLPLRVQNVGIRTVPVLECLIDDVFSIMDSAVVWMEKDGVSAKERVVSVELQGVSIEDSSESDASEGAEPQARGNISSFGMSVSKRIILG
ncbi:uncharacterized protein TM35_000481570 [Trypanosoma theileri]|uniref:Uncharacterized protein n=1 Tax=Trypanosoma theileri TaxID=67003 RepID=A0A1X0NHN9_9TRYP|nr:uncharacterized protein TM35_000481570 [Trypanosoma theileri]ORC84196.1 hypothetical protein TM35_000481570 [Trypanosoma theileri]